MLEELRECIDSYTSGAMWEAFLGEWIVIQIAIVLILLGFAAAAVLWGFHRAKAHHARRTWQATEGKVVSFDTHVSESQLSPGRNTYSYTVRYEYTDFHGRPQQGETSMTDKPQWGEILSVHTNKLEPGESMVIKKDDVTVGGLLAAVLAWLVVLAIALFAFWLFLEP